MGGPCCDGGSHVILGFLWGSPDPCMICRKPFADALKENVNFDRAIAFKDDLLVP